MSSVYESVTNNLIKLIEENRALPWSKPWHVAMPANAVTGRTYRGINALLLSATTYEDHRWLTFRQAMDLGGNVRKGQKATQVVLWKFDDDRGEKQGKGSAPLVRAYSVFNVEQCQGLKVSAVDTRPAAIATTDVAEDLICGYIDAPVIVHGGDRACYIPSFDRIEMPPIKAFVSSERYVATMAHELIHSSGAASRLARKGVTEPIYFGSECYALEELVAEIGASFLCAEIGISNTIEHSATYIDGWLNAIKRDKSLIIKAAGQAQRAADYILGRRPETQS